MNQTQEANQTSQSFVNPQRFFPFSRYGGPLVLMFLVTMGSFWNSLSGEFVYDDGIVIVHNTTIQSLKSIPRLFVQSYWTGPVDQSNYRPLTILTFALNYALGGLNPFGYHLLNVLIHGLNSFLVYWLAVQYTRRTKLALFTAILFAVHPIHTEVVSYVTGRSELVATTFGLLAWMAYYCRVSNPKFFWLSLFFYSLGLLAKESPIVLVGVLALADVCSEWPRLRTEWVKRLVGYSGYVGVTVVYLIIKVSVTRQLGVASEWTVFGMSPFSTRLFTMSYGFLKYFQLLIWPSQMCADYDFSVIPLATTFTARVAFSMLIVGLIVMSGFILLRYERLSAFAILFFFVTISVVSNLVFPIGVLISERALYFPSISICLLVGGGLDWIATHGSWKQVLAGILCSVLVITSVVRIYYRNLDWHDGTAWVMALIQVAPNNAKALLAYGQYQVSQKHYQEAEESFKRAVQVAPNKASTHGTLGYFYVEHGRYDEALPELKCSLEIYPKLHYVQIALARLLFHQKEYAQAVDAYRKGMSLTNPDPLLNQELGEMLFEQRNFEAAIVEFKKALELNPDLAEAQVNLGLALRALGRVEEATQHFRQAVILEPNNPINRTALGSALLNQRKPVEAVNELTVAIKLKSDYAEAHNNLGVALIQLQKFEEARVEFEIAVRINPQYTSAQQNLEQLEKKLRQGTNETTKSPQRKMD